MEKRIILFIIAAVVAFAGCSADDAVSEETGGSTHETENLSVSAEEETASEESPAESEGQIQLPYTYTWQEITVTFPDDWAGRIIVEEREEGFSIYQKASYEKASGEEDAWGYVCGFFRAKEPVEDGAGEILVADAADGTLYYLLQPMDVDCDTEDEEIAAEYIRMCQQALQLPESLQILASGVHYNAGRSIMELDKLAS